MKIIESKKRTKKHFERELKELKCPIAKFPILVSHIYVPQIIMHLKFTIQHKITTTPHSPFLRNISPRFLEEFSSKKIHPKNECLKRDKRIQIFFQKKNNSTLLLNTYLHISFRIISPARPNAFGRQLYRSSFCRN